MSGVNKVIIVGRLGTDPEVKQVGESTLARLSVATSEKWKDKEGQTQEKTEWHRVNAWGKLGEICGKHLAKGRQVYIEGSLQTRSWEDPQGGKKYATEIKASTVQFLGDAPGGRSGDPGPAAGAGFGPEPSFDSAEEIPF